MRTAEKPSATEGTTGNTPIKLLPGERIIAIELSPIRIVNHPPAAIHELTRLAHSKLVQHIGDNGPVLAALSLESSLVSGAKPRELRRYEALFGRDSLRVAQDLMSHFPRLARTTIIELAKLQGTRYNAESEEEPGRIIHESRKPGDAIRREITAKLRWGWPYYGSVDSTLEYIRTIVAYCNSTSDGPEILKQRYTDRSGRPQTIADSLERAVGWMTYRMDLNTEGLIESQKANPSGIANQFWKDSWDAYFHADGAIADHTRGVASVEVLQLAYDTLLDAAELYRDRLGLHTEAQDLLTRAKKLKKVIFEKFWIQEKGGYFALGSDRTADGTLRVLQIRTSNMGHLLASRLLEGDDSTTTNMRESVVRQLFSPELLSPYGIRTLATDEVRYRPGSYHNGSIWPWDNYRIIKGLEHHHYSHLAKNLADRLLGIIESTKLFPEFVRGDSTSRALLNDRVIDISDAVNHCNSRLEQPPQEVQAWSVAAIVAIKYSRKLTVSTMRQPISKFEQSILANLT